MRIRHVGFQVTDMDRAIGFYRRLGFYLATRAFERWGNRTLEVAKFRCGLDDTILELVAGDWPAHVAVEVDKFDGDPDKADDGVKVKFITDPDGNRVELVQFT